MRKISQVIHRIGFCLILILLHPIACSLAQSPQDEVQLWINQLDDSSYAVRQEAVEKLVASGKQAIAKVEEAASSESLEVSLQAFNVLNRLLDAKDQTTVDASLLALERLAASKNKNIANKAQRTVQPKELTDWIKSLRGEYDTNEFNMITALRLDRTRGIDPGMVLDQLSDNEMPNLQRLRWLKSLTLAYRVRITDAGLANLSQLKNLEVLNLSRTGTKGSSFEQLSQLKKLRVLDLSFCPIDENNLSALAKFPALRKVNLEPSASQGMSDDGWRQRLPPHSGYIQNASYRGGIGDAGVKKLCTATGLSSLSLRKTKITDKAIDDLITLENLEELDLSKTAITDVGLKKLKSLKQLRTLRLNFVAISDEAIKELGSMKNLRRLELAGTYVSGEFLKSFSNSQIEELDLTMTYFNDKMVDELLRMPKLRQIKLRKTPVSFSKLKSMSSELKSISLNDLIIAKGWGRLNSDRQLAWLDLQHQTLSTTDLKWIGTKRQLERLVLWNTNLMDADLQHFSELTKLRRLSVGRTELTDKCFEYLRGLSNLKDISCRETKISFGELAKFMVDLRGNRLEQVIDSCGGRISPDGQVGIGGQGRFCQLWNVSLRDEDLIRLATLPNIGSLLLNRNDLSDEGVAHLSDMKRLHQLWLSGRGITGVSLAVLSKLRNLKILWLTDVNINSEDLKHLRSIPGLTRLNLCGTEIDDKCVDHLLAMPSLQHLMIDLGALSADSIDRLKQNRPTLVVFESQNKLLTALRGTKRTRSSLSNGGSRTSQMAAVGALPRLMPPLVVDWVTTKVLKQEGPYRYRFGDEYFEQAKTISVQKNEQLERFELISQLSQLSTLTEARLSDVDISDRQVEVFCQIPNLKKLSFYRSRLKTDSLVHLANCPSIEHVNLHRANVSAKAIQFLSKLPNLKSLTLGGYKTNISGDGVEALANLQSLEELGLSRTGLVDRDMEFVGALPNLKKLQLREVRVGAGITHLLKLKQLEELDLAYTFADDQTLDQLAMVSKLKRLGIDSTFVTESGLKKFREKRPDVRVSARNFASPDELSKIEELRKLGALIRFDKAGRVWSVDIRGKELNEAVIRAISNLSSLKVLKLGKLANDELLSRLIPDLPKLTELNLSESEITNDGIKTLADLGDLQTLWIGKTNVTPEVTTLLAKHLKLENLSLTGIPVTDEHLDLLMDIKFAVLILNETKITDATCTKIGGWSPEIRQLYLDGTSISDTGFSELNKLRKLHYLHLRNTNVSAEKIAEFKRLRPGCEIQNKHISLF